MQVRVNRLESRKTSNLSSLHLVFFTDLHFANVHHIISVTHKRMHI